MDIAAQSLLLRQERGIAAQFYTVSDPRVLSITACKVSLRFPNLQFVSLWGMLFKQLSVLKSEKI